MNKTNSVMNESQLKSSELMRSLPFCVFDLETTGGNHKNDKIIEIGLVKIQNLEVIDQMSMMINPEMKIPEFIQKLTSISEEDVKGCAKIEDVIDDIVKFMGDSILVAHNTAFDVPFFNSVLRRLDRPELSNKSLCTNLMTKYLIPNLLNSNLNYMCRLFDIQHKKAHRALDDALATAELLIKFLKIFILKEVTKINHLYYPRNRYELDRVHFKEGTAKEEIIEKFQEVSHPTLVTLKGENGVILSAIPCAGGKIEVELIQKKCKELPWKMVSINLYGDFIEPLIQLNGIINKLTSAEKNEIVKFLWTHHLPKKKAPAKTAKEDAESQANLIDEEIADFIICHHLVPEQMIIFPLSSMHHKSQLIFRYPGHKKKLVQYINSKSSRLTANKLKKAYFHPALKDFIESYLTEEKAEKKSLFLFKKSFPMGKPDDFVAELDLFMAQKINKANNYPKEFI